MLDVYHMADHETAAGEEVARREPCRLLGFNMHEREIKAGDLHADLWDGLVIASRWVSGLHDITVGYHPALGRCAVSHTGLEDRIVWITEKPITSTSR